MWRLEKRVSIGVSKPGLHGRKAQATPQIAACTADIVISLLPIDCIFTIWQVVAPLQSIFYAAIE